MHVFITGRVKMGEVRRHLDETHFACVGLTAPDAVFCYRFHSPLNFIVFDHLTPTAHGDRSGPPTHQHVHVVVRTANGNGNDLLRQHYHDHPHPH